MSRFANVYSRPGLPDTKWWIPPRVQGVVSTLMANAQASGSEAGQAQDEQVSQSASQPASKGGDARATNMCKCRRMWRCINTRPAI
jgi:hypothetical protein